MRLQPALVCPTLALTLALACAAEPESAAPELVGTSLEIQAQRQLAAHGFAGATVLPSAPQRFRAHLDGIPLWGLDGKADGATVRFAAVRLAPGVAPSTRPRVSDATALAAALAELDDPSARLVSSELVLLPHEERRLVAAVPPSRGPTATDYERVITSLTLVHRLELTLGADDDLRTVIIVVDATTGDILDVATPAWSSEGYRTAAGKGKYSGRRILDVWFNDADGESRYFLTDHFDNEVWYVGARGGMSEYVSPDAMFGDGQLFKATAARDSANGETAAVNAYYSAGLAWSFYIDVLGRRGPNDAWRPFKIVVHDQVANAQYIPSHGIPPLRFGYKSLTPDSNGNLTPRTALDTVAHEMGHDFFLTEVFADPVTAPTQPSEGAGMNEATGDFLAVLAEMYRDVVQSGQPVAAIDALPLLPAYLDLGEQYGLPSRNVLDPFYDEWFDGIGDEDPHYTAGPIARMLVLLAYGCAHFDPATAPAEPRNCRRLPQGFKGIGPIAAVRLWAKAVTLFSESPDFVEARLNVLFAAFLNDGVFGGAQQRAAADAFAAINVGPPADRGPPTASMHCAQTVYGIRCFGEITDTENPGQFTRPPVLVLDDHRTYVIATGFTYDVLIPKEDLTHGPRRVELRAWDLWGNPVVRPSVVNYDKLGPTALVFVTGPRKQPTLQVTASDPSGMSYVAFYEGTVLLEDVSQRPPWEKTFDTATWSDGNHTIDVHLRDGYENENIVSTVVRVDNTRPAVTLAVGAGGPPFALSATVTDTSPITRVDFKLDGQLIASRTAPPYTASYTPLDGLAHNLRVEAVDSFDNRGSDVLAAPRDLTPPVVTFAASQTANLVTINSTVADSCGIETPYTLLVDEVVVAQPTTPGYALVMATLADGTHVFRAPVKDRCGNTNNFVATFVKTSNTPPVITGITRNDSQPKKPRFTVTCVDAQGVHHVEMRIDGAVVAIDTSAPYEFVVNTTGWPDGPETVLFQCSDTDSVASAPETRTVTADNSGPTLTYTVVGAGRDYVITANGVSDAHGIESVRLHGGFIVPSFSFLDTAAPYTYSWHIDGTFHIEDSWPFGAVARDDWGNERAVGGFCFIDSNVTQVHVLECD